MPRKDDAPATMAVRNVGFMASCWHLVRRGDAGMLQPGGHAANDIDG
jgi:hypothetical protein